MGRARPGQLVDLRWLQLLHGWLAYSWAATPHAHVQQRSSPEKTSSSHSLRRAVRAAVSARDRWLRTSSASSTSICTGQDGGRNGVGSAARDPLLCRCTHHVAAHKVWHQLRVWYYLYV